jgi:hypothetical protein
MSIYLYVGEKDKQRLLQNNDKLDEFYEQFKSEDNILYLYYTTQDTFGK